MADLNFPTSPALNATYSFNGKTWVWNGQGWQLQNQGAINGLVIGNSTPAAGTFTTLSATGDITAAGNVAGLNFNSTNADLAEMYTADAAYAPGTVVVFGGSKEVTINGRDHDTAVAGVVSTDPSYLMNSAQQGEFVLPVALTGRVPCQVQGPVHKGTVLVSGTVPGTAAAIDASKFKPGCVLGKSLETINSTDIKTIEIAVGRL